MDLLGDNGNLFAKLAKSAPTDILIHLDYDDCLDVTTTRRLSAEQKKILWDLHHLTQGGIIITTNSDGRSIFEMDGMKGFPVVSEFATVFRNIPGNPTGKPISRDEHGNIVEYLHSRPNCKAAFTAAAEKAKALGVQVTQDADILNADSPVIKIEEKEMGIALVFGKHASLKRAAINIAEHAFKTAGFSSQHFEIDKKGADAVEIKVKGAAKADIVDHLGLHPLYERNIKLAKGDSGSDLDVMVRLGSGIAVGNRIKDDKLVGINHIRIPSENNDFSETWKFLKSLRDTYMAHPTLIMVKKTAPAPR